MNILVAGLNDLSRKIIEYLKNTKSEVFGFDFDVDKIELFYYKNLIKNNPKIILEELLKQTDILILNTDSLRYDDIFKLSPFIKNDCIITNVNSYKETDGKMEEKLGNKSTNFFPCNFTFFPQNVIMNFSTSSKMTLIHSLSSFFKSVNIKTSALTPEENNLIFSRIYHIPFLLDNILFKINDTNFISRDNVFEYIYEDIVSNKNNILLNLKVLISHFPNTKNKNEVSNLLEEDILLASNNLKTDIFRATFGKVLIEKLMINLFQYRHLKTYIDNLNLDYNNYKVDFLKEYYSKNWEDIEILILLLREKISNLICFLEIENLTPNKLKKYLEN